MCELRLWDAVARLGGRMIAVLLEDNLVALGIVHGKAAVAVGVDRESRRNRNAVRPQKAAQRFGIAG